MYTKIGIIKKIIHFSCICFCRFDDAIKLAEDGISIAKQILAAALDAYAPIYETCQAGVKEACSIARALKEAVKGKEGLIIAEEAVNKVNTGQLKVAIRTARDKTTELQVKANKVISGVEAQAKSEAEQVLTAAKSAKARAMSAAQQTVSQLQAKLVSLRAQANQAANGFQAKAMNQAKMLADQANAALNAAQAAADAANSKVTGVLGQVQGAIDMVKDNNFLAINQVSLRVVVAKTRTSAVGMVDLTVGKNNLKFTVNVDMNNPSGSMVGGMKGETLKEIRRSLPAIASFIPG